MTRWPPARPNIPATSRWNLLHWIPSLLLVPYITYFFLLDGPRFKRFLVQAIPNAFFEKTLYLFYRVEDQLRRYFQGLLALTALDALCLGIGLWFLGLNAPFFLAGMAAVMAWLPYLGSIGGGLLVVLVAAHDFPDQTLAALRGHRAFHRRAAARRFCLHAADRGAQPADASARHRADDSARRRGGGDRRAASGHAGSGRGHGRGPDHR